MQTTAIGAKRPVMGMSPFLAGADSLRIGLRSPFDHPCRTSGMSARRYLSTASVGRDLLQINREIQTTPREA